MIGCMAVELSENVKRLMQERNINAAELARLTGLDRSHVSYILAGKRTRLEPETLIALAKGLEVSVDELLGVTSSTPQVDSGDQRIVHRIIRVVPRDRLEFFETFVRDWAFSPADDQRMVYEFQRVLKIHREHASHDRPSRMEMVAEEKETYEAR